MSTERCPRCQQIKEMRESITQNEEKDTNGEVKEITIKTYHCPACGTFIRSQNQ